jgi:hypothetical protein
MNTRNGLVIEDGGTAPLPNAMEPRQLYGLAAQLSYALTATVALSVAPGTSLWTSNG